MNVIKLSFQAKLAARGDDDVHKPEESENKWSSFEAHDVLIHKTRDELKVNLENVVSKSLQGELVEKLGSYLTSTATEEKLPMITFNNIAEDVYLRHLYMTFRKLGYQCTFSRYNSDRGMALFQRERPEEAEVKHSVFRSQLPNVC